MEDVSPFTRRDHGRVGHLIVHFERMSSVFYRVLGDAVYVMRSPNLDDVSAVIRYVLMPA